MVQSLGLLLPLFVLLHLLWLFFLHAVLRHSVFFSKHCVCTLSSPPLAPPRQPHPFLRSHVPALGLSTFYLSTDVLDLQMCISRLLIDISTRSVTNTLHWTYPELYPLLAPFQLCSTEHLVRNFRITSLCYCLDWWVVTSVGVSEIQFMTVVSVLPRMLIISCLLCCGGSLRDLPTCRLSHLSFLLNLYSPLLPLVFKAPN